MIIYDVNGIQRISNTGTSDNITVSNSNISTTVPPYISILGDDGFGYLIGVTIVNGQAVITVNLGSPLRMVNGVAQLLGPDNLWYSLLVAIINGQAVLGLSDTGVAT